MKIYGSKELTENVINSGLCIGCGACIDLCPYFKSYKGKTASLFPCSLTRGRCFAYCPKIEVDLDRISQSIFGHDYNGSGLGSYIELKTAKAGPAMKTGNFQSGGTVSALMAFALKHGYVDAAVLTNREGMLPMPRLVSQPDDVIGCSGSKYTAAPTLRALNEAVKAGYTRIGVVGTPCQVLSTAQLRANPMEEAAFSDPIGLVLGLFCTWALDYRAFADYAAKHVDIERIVKMDIPPPPSNILVIHTIDDKIELPLDEIRSLVPQSCLYCPDMTSEFSDISVGVLENRPDYNTLIVRSERGEAIVNEAVNEGYLIIDELPEESISHLTWAAENKKQRAMTKAVREGKVNTTAEDAWSIFRVSEDTIKIITG